MLEELRKKPKAVRNLYAFWGAVILTGLIALVWTLSLYAKFNKIDTPSFKEANDTTGAFSQFIEKTKQKFLNGDSPASPTEVPPNIVSTSSPQTASSSASSTKAQFRIATTTEEKVQVGTSSTVAE
ncbi:hypothetical protein A2837_00590 [Candidatus Kaiserbacteria bacterium RIFCSPHIGHO2_01_FULL_46_22]|uniref:Uncharacterized protein n=1 Tax=Candidatus Kaiserbacteria bacterium RIFCSPHIGHO2_01_FULL_46_22 TaxID=1798475 RepID=A0A1F6BXJ6_9BACT|nr:MAG: hypothetical protein A2837_00590 [Candidatus Kaiserbacteria bacterium RIFCSPHIGHO2_01_FULL_46_22]